MSFRPPISAGSAANRRNSVRTDLTNYCAVYSLPPPIFCAQVVRGRRYAVIVYIGLVRFQTAHVFATTEAAHAHIADVALVALQRANVQSFDALDRLATAGSSNADSTKALITLPPARRPDGGTAPSEESGSTSKKLVAAAGVLPTFSSKAKPSSQPAPTDRRPSSTLMPTPSGVVSYSALLGTPRASASTAIATLKRPPPASSDLHTAVASALPSFSKRPKLSTGHELNPSREPTLASPPRPVQEVIPQAPGHNARLALPNPTAGPATPPASRSPAMISNDKMESIEAPFTIRESVSLQEVHRQYKDRQFGTMFTQNGAGGQDVGRPMSGHRQGSIDHATLSQQSPNEVMLGSQLVTQATQVGGLKVKQSARKSTGGNLRG